MSYQWTFNGSNISGATLSSYTISSVQMSNAGPYAVAVGDATGTVMSDNASLTVLGMPVVLTNPPNVQVCLNSNLVLAAGLGGGVAQSIFWLARLMS